MKKARIPKMDASKTGFPAYVGGGETVRAMKIISAEPSDILQGAIKITFGRGKSTTLHPNFARQHNPQAGGYFIVADGWASYASPEEFEAKYVEKERALG